MAFVTPRAFFPRAAPKVSWNPSNGMRHVRLIGGKGVGDHRFRSGRVAGKGANMRRNLQREETEPAQHQHDDLTPFL